MPCPRQGAGECREAACTKDTVDSSREISTVSSLAPVDRGYENFAANGPGFAAKGPFPAVRPTPPLANREWTVTHFCWQALAEHKPTCSSGPRMSASSDVLYRREALPASPVHANSLARRKNSPALASSVPLELSYEPDIDNHRAMETDKLLRV